MLRMIPVAFFFFAVPVAGLSIYEYLTGLEESASRMLIILGLTGYFGFRSWYTVKLFVVFGEEEEKEG